MFDCNNAVCWLALAMANNFAFYDVAKFKRPVQDCFMINTAQLPQVLSAVGVERIGCFEVAIFQELS